MRPALLLLIPTARADVIDPLPVVLGTGALCAGLVLLGGAAVAVVVVVLRGRRKG